MDFYQWYVTNPQLIVAFWHGCLGFHVYYENTLFSLETYLTYGWDYKNTLFSVDLFDVWPTLWKYFQYNMGNYGLQTWQRLGPTLAKALKPPSTEWVSSLPKFQGTPLLCRLAQVPVPAGYCAWQRRALHSQGDISVKSGGKSTPTSSQQMWTFFRAQAT